MNIYHQAAQRFANMQRRNNQKQAGPALNDITRQLANELAKSRETASELHNLHSAMNDIRDTLGGGNVSSPLHHHLSTMDTGRQHVELNTMC